MPVDIARREATANVLVSFLRGDLEQDALPYALNDAINPEGEDTVDWDTYLDELLSSCLYITNKGPISEQRWEYFCRELAFLKSGLATELLDQPTYEDADRPRQILLARWHTLALFIVVGFSYWIGWWLFAVANLLSFLLYQVSLRKGKDDKERHEHLQKQLEYYPFANQDEWLAHKHLLDQYGLPHYNESHWANPTQRRRRHTFLTTVYRGIDCVFVCGAIAFMIVFSVVMWPLWLVWMSLCKRGANPL